MHHPVTFLLEAIARCETSKALPEILDVCVPAIAGLADHENVHPRAVRFRPSAIASSGAERLNSIAVICGIAATFVAALLAAPRIPRIRRLRRERVPDLELTLTVSREPTGDWHDILVLTLEAENTGNRAVSIDAVRWTASVLSPYDDDAVEPMKQEYAQRAEHQAHVEFPWHVAFRETVACDLSVKPGRTERIVYTHPIDSRIHALVASAYVYNEPNHLNACGWYATVLLIGADATVNTSGRHEEPTTPSGKYVRWRPLRQDTKPGSR